MNNRLEKKNKSGKAKTSSAIFVAQWYSSKSRNVCSFATGQLIFMEVK
jgi:hypothetical protein